MHALRKYNERFNGTLIPEVLKAGWFQNTKQAQAAIKFWLRQYNQITPHQALGMGPSAPETLSERFKKVVLRKGTNHCIILRGCSLA